MPNQPSRPTEVPTPSLPGDVLVRAANKLLEDPSAREQIRQMHESGRSLIQMVDDLGLDGDMHESVREVLEGLSPEVVRGIREATLEVIDRKDDHAMPLNCTVNSDDLKSPKGVRVEVTHEHGERTIHVRGKEHKS